MCHVFKGIQVIDTCLGLTKIAFPEALTCIGTVALAGSEICSVVVGPLLVDGTAWSCDFPAIVLLLS